MLEFSMPNDAYTISPEASSNTFVLRNISTNASTTYTIPSGTYSMYELARQFVIVTDGLLACSYLAPQNKLNWTLASPTAPPHTIAFPTGLASIVGLYDALPYPLSSVSPLVSHKPCRPLATTHLFVRWNDHSPEAGGLVLSNMALDGKMRVDNTLAVVNVSQTPPFHQVSWAAADPTAGGLWCGDTKLSSIELVVTDEEGRPIDYLPDFWCQLKVDVIRVTEDKTDTELLRNIDKSITDLLLYQHLQRQQKNYV